MYKALAIIAQTLVLLITLSGCGGGGGGGGGSRGPVASTLSFPLQTGYKALIVNGLTKSFTVTGSCTGSGTHSTSPANTAATFEGVAGLSATTTLTMSLSNCTPASITDTTLDYYDSNYVPLGNSDVAVGYDVWLTPPSMPTSVTVGATGTIGTKTFYTDSTKATGDGKQITTYVIEADTANTAIVNLISNIYDASDTLIATEQDRYRIDAAGTLTPISADILYADGMHLVLTYS
ncbi:protein of unknown function [Georgfuchsia toluolica]|uniref:Lipoprotein n=1 Tax=Georgfuchsia toluolica TaxID=424218 RepID=A0A916J5J9_9PROT|nr:hypothetical protein [Georgfuchsia toluolica]CAG4884403.1 protein of unknown function [Georgfuchsia toluolica]